MDEFYSFEESTALSEEKREQVIDLLDGPSLSDGWLTLWVKVGHPREGPEDCYPTSNFGAFRYLYPSY